MVARAPSQPSIPLLATPTMNTIPQNSLHAESTSRSNYQSIFDSALEAYKKKTGTDLTKDPLLRSLETCDSPDAVLNLLRAQILGPGPSQNSRDKLITWLDPTVKVINAFSVTVGGGIGLVSLTKKRVDRLPTCPLILFWRHTHLLE
jgi:hypothetical protein